MANDVIKSEVSSQPLEIISVGEFFQQINWYGRTMPGMDEADLANTPYETVGQFFATFPWQGAGGATTADDWDAVKDDETAPMEQATLTLEDLSALF
ncbi:hypothetical protein D0962_11495 [Leptolyngbyaceae cyanobacterium CCMR0082]|uniref:Uncharacterized protein n=1 Tax=Adonisia turfae CCMR0082 TaxID=2304604 RepID=A0A6M0S4H7_9CYAN|nr:hypothetical protein [Adonisia turfae]MDV3350552.1 hypothetical protein [Leptothoe sp. LEGE 181152]NEZ63404.1 hypothetical protein [Adonisia turfae CCMR0082]